MKTKERWIVCESHIWKEAQDLRDAYGPSADPSIVHWSLIRSGLSGGQEAIHKEGKQGEEADEFQITQ